MMDLLSRLSSLVAPANAAVTQTAEEPAASGTIGLVVLAIIVGPVIVLTIASMFGAPRTFRLPGLFLGSLVLLIGAIIVAFAIFGVLLGFIIPQ